MVLLGYAVSSEEHSPASLVEYASRAEATGFEFAVLSDHVSVHQVGPRQDRFFDGYEREVLPAFV
jgi:alkanesulfonate monooxygenase SsuD/methylene tetrahydromethanopterin reductase-like flavin-dependent oxidoreductase (luciferase family)